jgi:Co/Zn/Cd efflux system component
MAENCDDDCCAPTEMVRDRTYRRVLWIVMAINAAMFGAEIVGGLSARSASLQADSLDFLGDAANYAISLVVVGMTLRARAGAALLKAASMSIVGLWVLAVAVWNLYARIIPEAPSMGAIGAVALFANALSFGLLWRFRTGDANMQSAWICTRNDVIGNLAVILAAAGVFGTGSNLPDILVATIMACLGLQGAVSITRRSLGELRTSSGVELLTVLAPAVPVLRRATQRSPLSVALVFNREAAQQIEQLMLEAKLAVPQLVIEHRANSSGVYLTLTMPTGGEAVIGRVMAALPDAAVPAEPRILLPTGA